MSKGADLSVFDGRARYVSRVLTAAFLLLAFGTVGAEPRYPQKLERWQEILLPTDEVERKVREYAANYSEHSWRVFLERGQISAELRTAKSRARPERPRFTPRAGRFRGGSTFARVEDGWLVGFNEGEFGAAVYWFSRNGKRNYKMSDHQVVEFFSLPTGLHAIEGLAHLGMSRGSIIRIGRLKPRSPWEAVTMIDLPFAPAAISVSRNGRMFVTLSDSLVAVEADGRITTLLADAPWGRGLYPNSSALSKNEQKLYIGMRQFVGEFDAGEKKLRLLVPSNEFLNRLSTEEEKSIRDQYGSQ